MSSGKIKTAYPGRSLRVPCEGINERATVRIKRKEVSRWHSRYGHEPTPNGKGGTLEDSPNTELDELDRELEKRGLHFCRYADDCNIFVRSKKAGERVLQSLTDFIEKKLKLKVNRDKSGVRHCSDVKFLGYTVMPEGKIRVADKSIDRLKEKLKELTVRSRGVTLAQIVKELNAVIMGWTNYFHLADSWLNTFRDLDGWLRRKLRCYRLKQCGRKYTIFKLLRSFDIPTKTSWNVVMYSGGWWNMSQKKAVSEAMNLEWFARLGLQSLQVRMTGQVNRNRRGT